MPPLPRRRSSSYGPIRLARAFLHDNVADSDDHLTLDLSELGFVGATGLGLLITLRARMQRQHSLQY